MDGSARRRGLSNETRWPLTGYGTIRRTTCIRRRYKPGPKRQSPTFVDDYLTWLKNLYRPYNISRTKNFVIVGICHSEIFSVTATNTFNAKPVDKLYKDYQTGVESFTVLSIIVLGETIGKGCTDLLLWNSKELRDVPSLSLLRHIILASARQKYTKLKFHTSYCS